MRIACCVLLLTALPLAAQTDQYEDFTGFWLENDRAEAFAIAAPYPRVLAFRLKGGENPSTSPANTNTSACARGFSSRPKSPNPGCRPCNQPLLR